MDAIEINPSTSPVGTIIWLHGLGADGNDFAPIVPELQLPNTLPLRFIFPHAPKQPVTINQGYVMRAWYDIISLASDDHADHQGIQTSVELIHQLIQYEEKRGIPSENIILAGFSQGAVIALTTGLTYPNKLRGIMALSGYLPQANAIFAKKSQANQTTPIFLAHGTEDAIVPYFLGESLHQSLEQQGYTVSWHNYPMPHSVSLQEINDIAAWIKHCYQSNI